jgi:hypothetical protein
MNENFDISINLSAYKSVITEMEGKTGKVKGIFIPFEVNNIAYTPEKPVYINLKAWQLKEPKQFDKKLNTHLIKQSLTKAQYDALIDEQKKSLPIFGNVSVWNSEKKEVNNAIESGKVDEMPF